MVEWPIKNWLRFWNFVEKGAGCWNWTGSTYSNGYGRFALSQHYVLAHRFAYQSCIGLIPKGLVLDHLCRNRTCVNPSHLEIVTQAENIMRGDGWAPAQARQTHCKRGHLLSGDNLYIRPDGRKLRECLTCRRERKRCKRHNREPQFRANGKVKA